MRNWFVQFSSRHDKNFSQTILLISFRIESNLYCRTIHKILLMKNFISSLKISNDTFYVAIQKNIIDTKIDTKFVHKSFRDYARNFDSKSFLRDIIVNVNNDKQQIKNFNNKIHIRRHSKRKRKSRFSKFLSINF